MIKTQIVRCFSTRAIVDKWFNALQSRTHEEQQIKLGQCIEYSLQQDQSNHTNIVTDIIHRWAIEQPKTEALWTYDAQSNECQKLTFNDIYIQSSHFANIFTENQFNLTTGKSVLVILPFTMKERILIQLACLRNGLIVYSYDPKYLTVQDIRQRIRTSAIDCIITNIDHLEMMMKCTYNSLRPLKKCLVSHNLRSEPLPVGWHYLMQSTNNISEKRDTKIDSMQSEKRFLRHLLNDRPIDPYSHGRFSLRQMLIAYWLNMNKSPHLIWIKDDNDKISLAPWLLGSTIFYKKTDDIKTIFNIFEKYPIDTFCASKNDYQMLDQQPQQPSNIHLQQLLSTEPIIDPNVESRWYSTTNLHIYDNSVVISADLNNKSDVQSILKSFMISSKYKEFYGTDQHQIEKK